MRIVKIVSFSIIGAAIVGLSLLLVNGYPIGFGMHDAIQQTDGTAINGYDVVGYFTDGKAEKGLAENEVEWAGAKWLFTSQENNTAFQANPEKYVPQYGGHCSFAVSTGFAVECAPESWLIIEKKSYLLSAEDVKTEFKANSKELIPACNDHWK